MHGAQPVESRACPTSRFLLRARTANDSDDRRHVADAPAAAPGATAVVGAGIGPRRRRGVAIGIAAAAIVAVIAAPLGALAVSDARNGAEAALDSAGGLAVRRRRAPNPPTTSTESTCTSRRRSTPPSPPVHRWRSASRSTTRRPRRSRRAPCASPAPTARSTAPQSSMRGSAPAATPTSRGEPVLLLEAESRAVAAGSTAVVSFTVPAGRPRCRRRRRRARPRRRDRRRRHARRVGRRGIRHLDGARVGSDLARARVPADRASRVCGHLHGRAARGVDRPPRPPRSSARCGRRQAGRGRHRPAHHRLDPRAGLGCAVIGHAVAGQAGRLENETFPLAYADADVALQAQLELPGLLTPTTFSDVLDPGAFPDVEPPPVDPSETPTPTPTVPATGEATPEPTDPADPRAYCRPPRRSSRGPTPAPTSPGPPTTRSPPATSATSTRPDSPPRSSLPATSRRSTAGSMPRRRSRSPPPSSPTRGLTSSLRAASAASTEIEWRSAAGRLLAELAIDAGSGRPVTMLATFDRGAYANSDRVSDTIDEVTGNPWAVPAGLSDAIGAPPVARALVDEPEDDQRRVAAERMIAVEAEITEFATVLEDPRLLTGPVRRDLLAMLDVGGSATPSRGTPRSTRGSPTGARPSIRCPSYRAAACWSSPASRRCRPRC